jgi:glycosyltransferase involved in cell wall biosynthesis
MWPQALRPPSIQRLLGRRAPEIPCARITAFNLLGLGYSLRLRRARSPSDSTAAFLWCGRRFGQLVLARGFGDARAVYTFNTAGLEILEAARDRGMVAVMEQTIAPKRLEMDLLAIERRQFPEWEPHGGADTFAADLGAREAAEWAAADRILCACEFVRDGIARCGGPAEKCVIVPYGVDLPAVSGQKSEIGNRKSDISGPPPSALCPPNSDFRPRTSDLRPPTSAARPLRVLTVGAVGLRKGSPYVLETARRMGSAFTFRMVGHIGVQAAARVQLLQHLELTGPVPRSVVHEHFAWADVFLLPSICEGSATVTYEALAHGLPVICTPNTGSVVRDGLDGFLVPARDVDAIVDRLERLRANPELRAEMSINARARSAEFTVAAYGRRLLEALSA